MSEHHLKNRSHWPLVTLSTLPAVLGVLLPLILVRVVTPAEVGTFKVFFLYLGVAPALLLTSGVRSGLAYWAGQDSRRKHAMEASSALLLLIAMIGTILALTLNSSISSRLSIPPHDARLFAISLLGAIAGCFFEEAAIALGRVWTGALFYCGSELLRTIAIVVALFYYRTVSAVLIAHTAVSSLKLMVGYWYGYKLGLVGFSISPSLIKDVCRYALPVSCAYAFGIFIGSADQLLLAHRISPSEFALYSIGCLSIAPLFTFEQSVTRVLIPQMSEAFSSQQPRRAATLYQAAVDNLGFILIPAVTGLIVFAAPLVELFFTKRYADAAIYLQIFGLSYLLLIIPHDAFARSRGHATWILRTCIIFAGMSFLLCYLLIPVAGPIGALTGVLLSGMTLRLYSVHHFKNELALRVRDLIPFRPCSQYLILSLLLASLALFSRRYFSTSRDWLLVAGSVFLGIYLCLALPAKNRAERRRKGDHGVLLLSQSLQVGGLERMILHLSSYLRSENRWMARVFAYDHTNETQSLVEALEKAGVPFETFKKREGFSFQVIGRMLKTIYRDDISIIHSHDLGTLIYAVITKVCTFGRVSIVHTQHSFPSYEMTLRHRMYRRLFSLGIDQLGVVSDDVRSSYARLSRNQIRITLVENGVDFSTEPMTDRTQKISLRDDLIRELPDERQHGLQSVVNDLWILYQGRFFPGKGQHHSLRVWTEMSDQARAQAVLCFVGPESVPGEYDRIRSLAHTCPNNERIFILGASTEPLRWLRASDVFLSCSEYEGMPLAPLEAAGSGLPLLLSRIPGHMFLEETASLFPLNDFKDGAQRMQTLLSNVKSGGERYQRELWEGSRSIRERFSVAKMGQKYSALYSKATS